MVCKSGQIFLPFCHNSRVCQTDGRTDGQTDRILIARPRLHSMHSMHSMQRGKNDDDGQLAKINICLLINTHSAHNLGV